MLMAEPLVRTFFKADLQSRAASKIERRARDRFAWDAVCKQVDKRDKGHCRACGRRCDPNATTLLERAERHHIVYRSAGGEDLDINIVTLCAVCHADQHAARIDVRGSGNACEVWKRSPDGDWFLWRREIQPFVYERD